MIVTIKSYASEQIMLHNPVSGETIFLSPSEKCDVDENFMLQADSRVRIIKRHAPPPAPPVEKPAAKPVEKPAASQASTSAPAAAAKPVSNTPAQAPAAPSQASETVSDKPSSGSL